jgi:hypothetical protein
LFVFRRLKVISGTIAHPIGNKKAGFAPGCITGLGFGAHKSTIRKNGTKKAPIRPVTGFPPKRGYARIEP